MYSIDSRVQRPAWLEVRSYVAKTTWQEKVTRVANDLIMVTGVVGAIALYKGKVRGLKAYAAYAAIALTLRKIAAVCVGYGVFLAARPWPCKRMSETLAEGFDFMRKDGYDIEHIDLWKSGTRYDAYIITKPELYHKSNWMINALGNCQWFCEENLEEFINAAHDKNCNLLLINPPSSNGSDGWPTPYQMGAGYDAGLSYLEEHAAPKKIVMRGFSLGGAMLLEMARRHIFKTDKVSYLMISDRTFSRFTDIAAYYATMIVRPILRLIDYQTDGVEGSRRLSGLNIRHVVVNHHFKKSELRQDELKQIPKTYLTDGVIPDEAGLAQKLHQEDITNNKVFIEDPCIGHNGHLPYRLDLKVDEEIDKFLRE